MEFLRSFQEPLTIKTGTSSLHTGRNSVKKEEYTEPQLQSIFHKEVHKFILNTTFVSANLDGEIKCTSIVSEKCIDKTEYQQDDS